MRSRKEEIAIILSNQKKTGLNTVTAIPVGDKFELRMNGKPFKSPMVGAKAIKEIKKLKIDARHHDKTGIKLNQ